MLFRLSTKLARKIHVVPEASLPLDTNPFADWSAHLFTADRTQYVLIANTSSLYAMVMYGRGISNDSAFIQRAVSLIGDVMRDDDLRFIFERLIVPFTASVSFSKALNRAVTGSMNELVYQAKGFLIEDGLSPYDTSFRLHKIPMGHLKYDYPLQAFRKQVL